MRALWRAIGVLLLVFPLLPLPEWSGAPDIGPVWGSQFLPWGIGIGVTLVVALGAGRLAVGQRIPRVRVMPPAPYVAVLALLTTLGAAALATWVFERNPHSPDAMAQLLHAKAFVSGTLALPVPAVPEAFLILQTWITEAGWVSQYPPGHTALLAIAMLVRAEWLVDPVMAGASVVLLYILGRRLYGRRVAMTAAFLWATSAWVLFTSASYVSHVPAVLFTLAAWVAVLGRPAAGRLRWVIAGVMLGLLTTTRPLDGVAAAVPLGLWLAMRREWGMLPMLVLGMAPVAAGWGWFNDQLFGSPLHTGYGVLYGAEHDMGFHVDPFGEEFTPLVAISNAAVAIRRLHIYLFEWPIPALALAGSWALFGRQCRRRDVIVAVALLAAPLCYFFYWHSGFFRGPRFYYAVAPILVLVTARSWQWLLGMARMIETPSINLRAALLTAGVLVWTWGAAGVFPIRLAVYREGLPRLKLHPERELADRGVQRALVLVATSWGNRVMADLWAMGANPGVVERAYRGVDTCTLEEIRIEARSEGWSATRLTLALEQAVEETAVPPQIVDWPDPTIRLWPDQDLGLRCERELARDLAGFTLYAPLAWHSALSGAGVVFARDLYERNSELLALYDGWEVWRYAPDTATPEGLPHLTRIAEARGSAP